MPRPPPSRSLTVFLGRTGFVQPVDFIDPKARGALAAYPLRDDLAFEGTLFLPRAQPSTPSWVGFVSEGMTDPLPPLNSIGVSAVLVIRQEGRLFAFTFGHAGRSLLGAGSCEMDFGLKVVLNRVDIRQLRSMDTRNFEDIVVSTRKQTSRSSELGAFGLDVSRDLLRAVVGDPTDKTFFKRIGGADAAVFTTVLQFEDLGDICDELLEAYQATDYRSNFEWVDRVRQVRDQTLLGALDGLLVTALRSGQTGTMHLALPDIVDWEKIDSFSFGGSGRRQDISYPELTLMGYLDTLGAAKQAVLTLEGLTNHPVKIQYSNLVDPVVAFTVYKCLVWDTTHAGGHYALMDGRWYEMEAGFAARVVAQAQALYQPGAFLMDAVSGDSEGKYNREVARTMPDYALMDQRTIRTPDMASAVECCDLFSRRGEFIHVKKRGASATLSHLFAQGSVSAELFMQDQGFRTEVQGRLTADGYPDHAALIPADRPATDRFQVIYAIMVEHDDQGNPPPLPFFSAVNLMQHYQRLQRLGLRVTVRYIPVG